MARSPLEVVQSTYQAFGRGDLGAVMQNLADSAEWKFVGSRGLASTGSFRGKPQIARFFAALAQENEILEFEPREFLAGDDHVTVLGRERTRDRGTSKVFEAEWVHVFTVRDGLVTRYWGMLDTEAEGQARLADGDQPMIGGGVEASP